MTKDMLALSMRAKPTSSRAIAATIGPFALPSRISAVRADQVPHTARTSDCAVVAFVYVLAYERVSARSTAYPESTAVSEHVHLKLVLRPGRLAARGKQGCALAARRMCIERLVHQMHVLLCELEQRRALRVRQVCKRSQLATPQIERQVHTRFRPLQLVPLPETKNMGSPVLASSIGMSLPVQVLVISGTRSETGAW
jgi:hypothetical protein